MSKEFEAVHLIIQTLISFYHKLLITVSLVLTHSTPYNNCKYKYSSRLNSGKHVFFILLYGHSKLWFYCAIHTVCFPKSPQASYTHFAMKQRNMTYKVKGKKSLLSEIRGSRTGQDSIYRSPGTTKWNSVYQVLWSKVSLDSCVEKREPELQLWDQCHAYTFMPIPAFYPAPKWHQLR